MLKSIIFLTLLITLTSASPPNDRELDDTYTFDKYLIDFHKDYNMVEHFLREFVFYKNLAIILKHNADETQSWRMGINKFVDMTNEEHKQYRMKSGTGKRRRSNTDKKTFLESTIDISTLPDKIDWRDKNVVSPVKD